MKKYIIVVTEVSDDLDGYYLNYSVIDTFVFQGKVVKADMNALCKSRTGLPISGVDCDEREGILWTKFPYREIK